ncbi:hypothetical protein GCM10007424_02350 [Flavobacterium suaedae]|uniref:Uncharacterized protein n=1 Tax=Flavobacterium suaedae TaxID=1767027 RepID=A0ABQ1JDQ0_9FLAO|nr:hypothetical protein [Flavobacterium suaedae]GGB65947.1 hypothetical protein GCM10007424_02350 [Flavobacterium suaedae]
MENKDYFKAITYSINEDVKSENYVYTDDLLKLINDDELKEAIINKYNLDTNLKIENNKIEYLYNLVKQYSERFTLIRLEAQEKDVTCELKSEEVTGKPIYIFHIKNGNEGELLYDSIHAEAIYDSINLFYSSKSLSQYVKSLKKVPAKRGLLNDLNDSWSKYYNNNENASKAKLFRILNHKENYYLKSINTSAYKEYGIAESFVMTILELDKFKKQNPDVEFIISSVSISESKLDIIISQKKSIELESLGFLRSSISIRNKDQGNTSFGVYSTLEFYPKNNNGNKIYLFPKEDKNKIKNSVTSNHTVSIETFIKTFSNINELFNSGEQLKQDFHFYQKSKNYDELRAKIEFKMISHNSPFKNITRLKELFSRKNTGHIENLEKLLRVCAESDSIEMEYDLKFKLRYLISNVLLYNKY